MANFDYIHDIQKGYRKVLNSMARPGIIENLTNEVSEIELNEDIYESTFFIMMMVLDREVSFNVVSNDSADISEVVSAMTYSRVKPLNEADYIFVTNDVCNEKLHEVIKQAKIGDLENPNKSATVIAEFDEVSQDGDLIFKGPGIKDENKVYVSGDKKWIRERENKNSEYPLGIDCILLDKSNKVLCIPRTTNVK